MRWNTETTIYIKELFLKEGMYRYDVCTKLFDKINDNFIHLFQSIYTLYLFLKSCSLYSVRRSNIHNVSPL
jgi:hypothetical protein